MPIGIAVLIHIPLQIPVLTPLGKTVRALNSNRIPIQNACSRKIYSKMSANNPFEIAQVHQPNTSINRC
jgi:hypothetical protein